METFHGELPDPRKEVSDAERPALIARLERLALSFPTLRKAPGVKPWNEEQFETWVHEQAKRAGDAWEKDQKAAARAAHAGLFLLSLVDRLGGPGFELALAMASWNEAHRDAFRAWVADPFWVLSPVDDDNDKR
jgi:hypothetical protein